MSDKPKRGQKPMLSRSFGWFVILLIVLLAATYAVAWPTTPNGRAAAAPAIEVVRWRLESDACYANRAALTRLQASTRYQRASLSEQVTLTRPYLSTATRLHCPVTPSEAGS